VILLIARRRAARDAATAHEQALLAGLLGLVLLFLISVPLAEARIALAVQLQVNRIFWVLDAVTALYVAWWLMNDLAARWAPRKRLALAALLIVASAARGFYVVRVEAGRALVQADLPPTAWTDAMRWIETGPRSWHVLADPEHAWKYGASVRVAARRDTLLETGKDTAMAMYDRPVAMRVAERMRALQGFDELSTDDLRRIDRLYGVDVLVDRADRPRELPVLYRNAEFVVYDLR
jgi:hypothetical protein